MTSNLLGTSVADVLDEVFGDDPAELFVVDPSARAVEALVDAANDYDGDLPSIRVLGDERTLKDVTGDFIVASNAANLVESGDLELRTFDGDGRSSMLVTQNRTVALVETGGLVAGLATDDDEFAGTAYDAATADWADAEAFTLRTPAIDRVRSSLDDDIGTEVGDDFDDVLASLETARGDGDGLDEVTISLLVAAKNRELLYDISKWGEDVGIASKATFSRTKTKLEDLGLIDTEKVPIDVGRPRLRLKLADDRLEDAPAGDFANVAESMLA
ncbi:transcriptional regulator TbsP [Halobacterium jilantaiense]|uniref:Transcriptional regulator n=1 Tax=Halobacterium jilantaiense TaxID=355548 RepID=A0A1I0QSY3_9EURY|nr:DUF5821 family protein [Halobacterium jilantaiense]SEW30041.1 hypothetical protein SAMN04487945_2888 [Halobacterium jilantaiense]